LAGAINVQAACRKAHRAEDDQVEARGKSITAPRLPAGRASIAIPEGRKRNDGSTMRRAKRLSRPLRGPRRKGGPAASRDFRARRADTPTGRRGERAAKIVGPRKYDRGPATSNAPTAIRPLGARLTRSRLSRETPPRSRPAADATSALAGDDANRLELSRVGNGKQESSPPATPDKHRAQRAASPGRPLPQRPPGAQALSSRLDRGSPSGPGNRHDGHARRPRPPPQTPHTVRKGRSNQRPALVAEEVCSRVSHSPPTK